MTVRFCTSIHEIPTISKDYWSRPACGFDFGLICSLIYILLRLGKRLTGHLTSLSILTIMPTLSFCQRLCPTKEVKCPPAVPHWCPLGQWSCASLQQLSGIWVCAGPCKVLWGVCSWLEHLHLQHLSYRALIISRSRPRMLYFLRNGHRVRACH